MIWRVRSTTLETRCGSIGPIPTCRRRRTTLDWLTCAIAPVWISIARTTDWVGWGHGEWPLVQTHTSGRCAISTPPRGVTSKPAATSEQANSARAAEAMTHVPEHLAQIGDGFRPHRVETGGPNLPVGKPDPKTKGLEPREREFELPPALPPGLGGQALHEHNLYVACQRYHPLPPVGKGQGGGLSGADYKPFVRHVLPPTANPPHGGRESQHVVEHKK